MWVLFSNTLEFFQDRKFVFSCAQDRESLTVLLFIKNVNVILDWAIEMFQCSVNNNMTDLYNISFSNKTEEYYPHFTNNNCMRYMKDLCSFIQYLN